MKIAIFGGSFDPPHLGHDKIIKMVLNSTDIDKIFIVPAWQNPLKSSTLAPSDLRLKWVRTLWQNIPKVEILDYEIKQNRPVRTYETIQYLKSIYKIDHCYLIIGADNISNLHKWYKINEIKKECEFIIATRNDEEIPEDLKKLSINVNISSTRIRERFDENAISSDIEKEVILFYQGKKMSERIDRIVSIMDEKKAEDIQVFNMQDKDYFVSDVVIATISTERHAMSILDELKEKLKSQGESFLNVEISSDWVVIDLGDMLIHLLSSEYRSRYNIEEFLVQVEEEFKKSKG